VELMIVGVTVLLSLTTYILYRMAAALQEHK
jgi:hypothetical protein